MLFLSCFVMLSCTRADLLARVAKVREKSGNDIFSQGNLKEMKKVIEKSGNFKIFLKRC